MTVGKLRHYITIQSVTENRNSYGDPIASWGTFAQVWAEYIPLSGREFYQAQQTAAQFTARFRIRNLAGVVPKMRISWDSRTFDIQSVVDDQYDRYINLFVIENL